MEIVEPWNQEWAEREGPDSGHTCRDGVTAARAKRQKKALHVGPQTAGGPGQYGRI